MKSKYELALVLSPDLDDQGREESLKLGDKIVKQLGGEVNKREEGGKKMLAYEIKKKNEGWFYFWQLILPTEALKQLEIKLNMEEGILRYLLVAKS